MFFLLFNFDDLIAPFAPFNKALLTKSFPLFIFPFIATKRFPFCLVLESIDILSKKRLDFLFKMLEKIKLFNFLSLSIENFFLLNCFTIFLSDIFRMYLP